MKRTAALFFRKSNPLMKQLTRESLNPNLLRAEYAVRGSILLKANEYKEIIAKAAAEKKPNPLPFNDIVFCNIGNPQSLGQKPITFNRNVLSLVLSTHVLDHPDISKVFPADAIARAKLISKSVPGNTGAYSHSKGLESVRRNIAQFIERRDGFPSDPEMIFITDGASPAVQMILRTIIRSNTDGIMIPIPQYPLYSASIELFGGSQVHYLLDESKGWGLDTAELKRSLSEANKNGINVRALCIINPGNPTGQVMEKANMEQIIQFCAENNLILLADEVYQENIYQNKKPFHSFKKVLCESKYKNDVELVSFHSVSKGFLGECGRRGGYMELFNIDQQVVDELYKLASINLCPNVDGQLMVDLMVNPPKPGDASYEQYVSERDAIIQSLKRRAQTLVKKLNELEGVTCNEAEGAMYAFPMITLPPKAIAEAQKQGIQPDLFYAMKLLEATGVCVVPGSGFGQKQGTYHFRTTFLPPEDQINSVVERMGAFHAKFMKEYK
eukprot:GEZU01033141.1.p1 GENE.GEZU01033141.1~~GEZU01033141.1.p1  ORF type:complete len:499 (-),score=198.56 GEZU01033141.1:69-1565(-)